MYGWIKLLADFVVAMAWPGVALATILMVRPHIPAILARLRTMKGLGVEFSLADAADELAKSAVPVTPLQAPELDEREHVALDIYSQFLSIWKEMEALLVEIGNAAAMQTSNSFALPGVLLHAGLIDVPLYRTIRALRSARNEIVHSREPVEVTQMIAFTSMAREVIERLTSVRNSVPTAPQE